MPAREKGLDVLNSIVLGGIVGGLSLVSPIDNGAKYIRSLLEIAERAGPGRPGAGRAVAGARPAAASN